MHRFRKTALLISAFLVLTASPRALAHEQPFRGEARFLVNEVFEIGGGVYQRYDVEGMISPVGDVTGHGGQIVYLDGGFMMGQVILTAARGNLRVAYFGFTDEKSNFYGIFTIEGGSGSYEHHYGWGWHWGSFTEEGLAMQFDGLIDHPE